jgi:hypothetical protein
MKPGLGLRSPWSTFTWRVNSRQCRYKFLTANVIGDGGDG